MVRDLAEPFSALNHLDGLELRQVHDQAGIRDAVSAASAAFGKDDGSVVTHAEGRLNDPTVALFVAYLDGTPVSSGRVEHGRTVVREPVWRRHPARIPKARNLSRTRFHPRAAGKGSRLSILDRRRAR